MPCFFSRGFNIYSRYIFIQMSWAGRTLSTVPGGAARGSPSPTTSFGLCLVLALLPSADSSVLTKDFCPAGLSGFLAQIFKETSFHGMSIPSTFFLTRTFPSRERNLPRCLLGWGPPGLFLQWLCFNLCAAAQPAKFSGAPGR